MRHCHLDKMSRVAATTGAIICVSVHSAVWISLACSHGQETCLLAAAFLAGTVASACLGAVAAFAVVSSVASAKPMRLAVGKFVVPPLEQLLP